MNGAPEGRVRRSQNLLNKVRIAIHVVRRIHFLIYPEGGPPMNSEPNTHTNSDPGLPKFTESGRQTIDDTEAQKRDDGASTQPEQAMKYKAEKDSEAQVLVGQACLPIDFWFTRIIQVFLYSVGSHSS